MVRTPIVYVRPPVLVIAPTPILTLLRYYSIIRWKMVKLPEAYFDSGVVFGGGVTQCKTDLVN